MICNSIGISGKMFLLSAALILGNTTYAQLTFKEKVLTKDDTLRGSITEERSWWDLTYYELKLNVDPKNLSIAGSTAIQYKVLKDGNVMQIDLQEPLRLILVTQDGHSLKVERAGKNAYFVHLEKVQTEGNFESVIAFFEGQPVRAERPPWVGGIQWQKDKYGADFIATSCQGLGASIWWACKDHMYDEPDSMLISITAPQYLVGVANGKLRETTKNQDGTTTFDWFVANPINNYCVNMNIAFYEHISDTLSGANGALDLNYYVLHYNKERAKKHFEQVKLALRAFEYWFGPYPFYEDGYKLVEVPYLGMEHQSSVTYGNEYMNGYLGEDLSGTGWGLKWDYVIVHETAHEWFANSITYRDIADMWIHEGFELYADGLFIEQYYGEQAGAEYVLGTRKLIQNDRPIIGRYNVNEEGSGDMYCKGANVLLMLRQIFNDDDKWRETLRGLNKEFYHSIVSTHQVEDFISKKAGKDLQKVFDQYLRDVRIPILEYKLNQKNFVYRWTNCIEGFDMPMRIGDMNEKFKFIFPTTEWKSMQLITEKAPAFDFGFYVDVIAVK